MTVRVYRSSDAGAPTLTNAIGSLTNLLDACLVTGYGSQSPAGWSKPFSSGGQAIFRQGGGNQMYLEVTDTALLHYANVRGWITATGVGQGTGMFPLVLPGGYPANGTYWFKSANATAVAWAIIATEKSMYFWYNYANGAAPGYVGAKIAFFGDLDSFRSPDNYATMLIGDLTATQGTFAYLTNDLTAVYTGHTLARGYHQAGGAVQCNKFSDITHSGIVTGRGSNAYPDPITGKVLFSPIWVAEPNTVAYPTRGTMPGVLTPLHLMAMAHGDTITGAPGSSIDGRTYEIFYLTQNPGVPAQVAIETSNTW